jgi:hypothetical protein
VQKCSVSYRSINRRIVAVSPPGRWRHVLPWSSASAVIAVVRRRLTAHYLPDPASKERTAAMNLTELGAALVAFFDVGQGPSHSQLDHLVAHHKFDHLDPAPCGKTFVLLGLSARWALLVLWPLLVP